MNEQDEFGIYGDGGARPDSAAKIALCGLGILLAAVFEVVGIGCAVAWLLR